MVIIKERKERHFCFLYALNLSTRRCQARRIINYEIKKMANYRRYCMLLLVTLSDELFSGTQITQKYACLGDTVYLFENITFDIRDTVVSLYKVNLIAMWIMLNSNITETKIVKRVFLENNQNICIRTFRPIDQGKYSLVYQRGNWNKTYEVQVNSSVAPNMHCTPKIKRYDDILDASLEREEDCGKPVVHVYWQNNYGISSFSTNHKTLVKLTPRIETVTYNACVEGPALNCARNSTQSDYCSNITIEGHGCLTVTCAEISDMKIVIGLCIPLGVAVIIIAVVCFIFCKKRFRGGTYSGGRTGARDIRRNGEELEMVQVPLT